MRLHLSTIRLSENYNSHHKPKTNSFFDRLNNTSFNDVYIDSAGLLLAQTTLTENLKI